MRNRWLQIAIMASLIFGMGFIISQVREQVHGQQPGSPATSVVVKPQWEPPRWPVEFTDYDDPAQSGKKITMMTVVVPEEKRILVYQLEMGKVKLVSVRNMQFDLQLDEFNATSPTPQEIEREVERLKRLGP